MLSVILILFTNKKGNGETNERPKSVYNHEDTNMNNN